MGGVEVQGHVEGGKVGTACWGGGRGNPGSGTTFKMHT